MLGVLSYYTECQNEPSKPDSDLITVPEFDHEREALMRALMAESLDSDSDCPVTYSETEHREYCDFCVSCDDTHIFLTLVNLPG